MQKQFHILNGEALYELFPKNIKGTKYIVRECLIEGNVEGDSLKEFFDNRAQFIEESFEEIEPGEYDKVSVSEFEKILSIPENHTINLWFEDDLFCQVNFWFVIHLLNQNKKKYTVYLIRPSSGHEYSFGSMTENELIQAFQNRMILNIADLNNIENLWNFYRHKNWIGLKNLAENIRKRFPFILPAVQAQIERNPENFVSGRPYQTLHQIIEDLGTIEFKPIFKEFCNREPIYGFGDLQVMRMLKNIVKRNKNE